MRDLSLHLLGPPLLEHNGRSVQGLRRKSMALLIYLAVDHQPHSRDALATLFWPAYGQSRARANLRRCLFSLNREAGAGVLTSEADTLRLDDGEITTDVQSFRRLAAGCQNHDPGEVCEDCLPLLQEAATLYQNDFLFGFTLPDCNDFDQWQLIQCERLRAELAGLLRKLVSGNEARGAVSDALFFAERLLALDTLEESSHRLLMHLYAQSGRRAAAYRQYESCRRILKEELGEEPDETTERLLTAIRPGKIAGQEHVPARPARVVAGDVLAPGTVGRLLPGTRVALLLAAAAEPADREQLVRIVGDSDERSGVEAGGGRTLAVHAFFPTIAAAVDVALRAQMATGQRVSVAIHEGDFNRFGIAGSAGDLERGYALLSVVPRGEIILSAAAALNQNRQPLSGSVSVRSLGYHRLADLGSPEMLYQVLHPQHVRENPVLVTLDSVRNNLPSQQEPLIGRKIESAEVEALLASPEIRMLTLTGPAGTGKTRLALHAAARSLELFVHGACFVDLAPIRDPDEVGRAISSALDIRESTGQPRTMDAILADYLRGRRLLLILDNFEHLLQAAAFTVRLLAAAPGLKILVTSRQRLRVGIEREYCVPSLTLPERGANLEALVDSESARLFLNRAQISRPGLDMNDQTARAIAEICIRLDGLPLAIELAAARLKVLSPADLARMLPERLNLLNERAQDRPQRQQTLEQAIDWSYDLLDDPERRLFARLSVFVGGWTLEAAESVCSFSAIDEPMYDVLDGIASLLDKNLVRRVDRSSESRYSMLETIREYARRKLAEDPSAERVRDRHGEYFRELAEEAERHLHGPNQMEWFDRLEGDYENFRITLTRLMERGATIEATRICVSIEWYWYRYGHLDDARQWLTAVVAADSNGARELASERGRALRALGWVLLVQGDWTSARDRYVESLRIAQGTGDRRDESLALSGLGTVERWIGETAKGSAHVKAGIELARDLRDPFLIASALVWAYSTTGGKFTGDPPIGELEEALELSRRLGDLWLAAHTFNGLGDIYTQSGDYRSARVNYEKALERFRELKDRWLTAWNLEGLARVALLDSDFPTACRTTKECISLFDELGDRTNVVFMLGWLGTALQEAGGDAHAAVVFGAFHGLGSSTLSSVEFAPVSERVAAASAASREAAPESWEAGRAMSYEQAVAFAVAECRSGELLEERRPRNPGPSVVP